jgi:hypothetical protein
VGGGIGISDVGNSKTGVKIPALIVARGYKSGGVEVARGVIDAILGIELVRKNQLAKIEAVPAKRKVAPKPDVVLDKLSFN